MADSKCNNCGKDYWASSGSAFCSQHCFRQHAAAEFEPCDRGCARCGDVFLATFSSEFYCHACNASKEIGSYSKGSAKARHTAYCKHCGQESGNRVFCSSGCRLEHSKTKRVQRVGRISGSFEAGTRGVKGKCVYGWFIKGHELPFYIGKGYGERVLRTHMNGDRKAPCERVRQAAGGDFVAVVFKDNLTEEGALLAESLLINVFKSMGALLSNVSEPLKRQELPPLFFGEVA
jgi:hypothetical protein